MDLRTSYMGMPLANPVVPSASPLSRDVSAVRQMEDAGAGAVVLYSLFEEQLSHESSELAHHLDYGTESFGESLSFFPELEDFETGAEPYLEHIRNVKAAVDIPVIGSLNGITVGGWIEHARQIQSAGADGLELNVYYIPTHPEMTGEEVEMRYLDILEAVKKEVRIPVAMKLSPFFSSIPSMAKRLGDAGADGLALFNRFYQPDIDLETLTVGPNIVLSSFHEMRLPLRWTAILHGRVSSSLAITTGVARGQDVIKAVMAGADVAMVCSVLYKYGIREIESILKSVRDWMEENEYESIEQMKGSMSQASCPDPQAFERANYMKALTSFT